MMAAAMPSGPRNMMCSPYWKVLWVERRAGARVVSGGASFALLHAL